MKNSSANQMLLIFPLRSIFSIIACQFHGRINNVLNDQEYKDGAKYIDDYDCYRRCTEENSCVSITMCSPKKGVPVCYSNKQKTQKELESNIVPFECGSPGCSDFDNCTTFTKKCPPG